MTNRSLRSALAIIAALLIIPVGLVALGSGSGLIALPYEMFLLDARMPVIFRAHMITSAFALLLMPAVLLLRHRPIYHRMLGRLVGAFVVVGGLTALPVAIFSDSSPAARAGFFAQGIVWMYLLSRGILCIRSGDRHGHAFFMLAMAAVTTGAVWFRLITGTAILLHLPFEGIYALASWLGWLIPLAVVIAFPALHRGLLLRQRQRQPIAPLAAIV